MLLELLVFYALAILATTLLMLVPGAARAPLPLGFPAGLVALAVAAAVAVLIFSDRSALPGLIAAGVLPAAAVRLWQRRWSWAGAQLLAAVGAGALAYLAYAAVLTFFEGLPAYALMASLGILVLEVGALALSFSYAFEIVDVLSRRPQPPPPPDRSHQPWVALQVPAYNEPVDVVEKTLRSLAAVDYPNLLVQVVDNNTEDEAVWRPLQKLCQELGDRFQFIHLENWPGYKAGALNEATRRLRKEIEIVGIVDADYEVDPDFPGAVAGYFADPKVAFVQTPQDYRDWRDERYLRGLYYSYNYFFAITMPSRANRNAIIFAGTMGLIRRSALDEIGGWNADVVTEDAEASLRMLGRGHSGVYVARPHGRGMMPLSFDGLKKQRFRWALGGIQILRLHWRELVPFAPHRLRLTAAQRTAYLLGSLQWFGDVLIALFTLLLMATALATALHHRLPVRVMTGAAMIVPLAFLVTGVGRAVWAMRAAVRCSLADAFNGLRVWFALSWVVSLACLSGLLGGRTAFLRTPKEKEGGSRLWHAVRASQLESLLTVAAAAAALAMIVASPNWTTAALAVLLLFQAFVYSNAVWASLGAEGITLTPERRSYLRSSQNTGERPSSARGLALPAAFAGLAVAVLVVLGVLGGPSTSTPPFQPGPQAPAIARPPQSTPAATPSSQPSPVPSTRTVPSAAPSPRATATP